MIGLDGAAPLCNGNALDHVFQFAQNTRPEYPARIPARRCTIGCFDPSYRDERVSTGW
jgi:hypothetical protein